MDDSRFDHLIKQIAAGGSRRSVIRTLASISLTGAAAVVLTEDGEARARRGKGVQSEHFKHKKKWYCVNGESVRRYRRKQEKLLAQGATLGKCGDTPPPVCTPDCEGKTCGPDGCGGVCGTCAATQCCDGTGICQPGDTEEACGFGGATCQVCAAGDFCFPVEGGFACLNISIT